MTAKEYLQQYLHMEHSINSKLEQVARLRSLAVKTTQSITDSRVQGTPKSRMEDIIAKIIELEGQIDAEIDKLYQTRERVQKSIDGVARAEHRQVLRYRYINGWSFEEIAMAMNYSVRQIHYFHSYGLGEIKDCSELQ